MGHEHIETDLPGAGARGGRHMTLVPPLRADVTVLSLDAPGVERITPMREAVPSALVQGNPVRQFRMHKGQPHWSGTYWAATTGELEVYESRLELVRLMLADHDPAVVGMLSQPFTLRTRLRGKPRRHTPDFLFVRSDGHATVVNVKPAHRLDDPKVAETFAWTRRAVEDQGWEYEVWSGADDCTVANIRALAAYRDARRLVPGAVEAARGVAKSGMTIGQAIDRTEEHGYHRALCKPAVLRLLWTSELTVDLAEPLSNRTLLLPGRTA